MLLRRLRRLRHLRRQRRRLRSFQPAHSEEGGFTAALFRVRGFACSRRGPVASRTANGQSNSYWYVRATAGVSRRPRAEIRSVTVTQLSWPRLNYSRNVTITLSDSGFCAIA